MGTMIGKKLTAVCVALAVPLAASGTAIAAEDIGDEVPAVVEELSQQSQQARVEAVKVEQQEEESTQDLPPLMREPENHTFALPALLIPILKQVGSAAAKVILAAVMTWGVAESCKKLKGKYETFDRFCKANDWQ